jgi:hypothetical protein
MCTDIRDLVSSSDLIYPKPAAAPYDGQPIGNGRMGTLVWTTPGSVCFQINRVDVFAVGRNHQGDQAWPLGPKGGHVDYCGGCAAVTIDLGGSVFEPGAGFEQRLSLFDAEEAIRGNGVTVQCFVSSAEDVLAVQIIDNRPSPQPVRLTIGHWRLPEVKTGKHLARWEKVEKDGITLISQQFEEKEFYCSSAVAGKVITGSNGITTVLISSASSWSRERNPGTVAMKILEETSRQSYRDLFAGHAEWWSGFWSRTFVSISSQDGQGEFFQKVRYLHLYYMGSTSRGKLPPKYNGLLFITDGDTRYWGSQYWVWTIETMYFPLLAADAVDLTEPYFDMYVRQLPACEAAARQRWGVTGAFFPETTPFEGPVVLPETAGREFQDVYLGRKPMDQLSPATHDLCTFDSSLRTIAEPEKNGPVGRFSWISHLVSSGSELAIQAWWRYRYTGDRDWLRTKGYPLLKGTVEFYRHMVKKGTDGKYHIHGTNVHEAFWGVDDGIMDLAAIRGTVPLAIRTAEILGVDEDLRGMWKEFLDHLVPYPMGSDPKSKALTGGVLADDVWSAGHLNYVKKEKNLSEDVWLNPVFPFEDWTLETPDSRTKAIVQKLVDMAPRLRSILNGEPTNTAVRTPIVVARAGLGEQLPRILSSYYSACFPLINFLSPIEGWDPKNQAQSVEHLGCITTALQEGLLQSVSPRPGEPEVIRIFPAWPKEWTASFRLLARGNFLISSSIQKGQVEFVEIESRQGGPCLLRNPWSFPCVIKNKDGETKSVQGTVLCFETIPGQSYRITPV